MRNRKNKLVAYALLLALAVTPGCATITGEAEQASTTVVVDYNTDSLRHYKAGRDFSAAGRYELAREHYLLALAATNNPALQDALVFELDSIDLMIKSLR